MLYRLLMTGLISGAVAGVIVTIVHLLMVEPLIFAAEQFEGEAPAVTAPANPVAGPVAGHTHSNGLTHSHQGGGSAHEHQGQTTPHVHQDQAVHDHEAWQPADGFERSGLTLVANLITAIAFGLLLATALTLHGTIPTLNQGLAWGAAGFLCFSLLPGLGLPPEVPGSAAAEILPRQIWWLSTAFVSAFGLAVAVFAGDWRWKAGGVVAMIIPHVIGAPHPPAGMIGSAPPELAAHFVVNTLFATVVMWVVLGVAAAYVSQRLAATDTASATAV